MKNFKPFMTLVFLLISPLLFSEEQVSLDSEGKYFELNEKQIQAMGLFSEIGNISQIRAYRLDSGDFELELLQKKGNKFFRQKKIYSSDQFKEFQEKIDLFVFTHRAKDQSGRVEFLVGSTALGYVYGFNTVSSFQLLGGSAVAVLNLVGASGFLLPYFLTEKQEITKGEAYLAIGGGIMGYFHGMWLTSLISGVAYVENISYSLLGIGEMVAGYYWAQSAGQKEGASLLNLVGMLYGAMSGSIVNQLLSGDQAVDPFSYNPRVAGALLLSSTLLGTLGSVGLNAMESYTSGDTLVFLQAIGLGFFFPPAISAWFSTDPKLSSTVSLIGSTGGIALGWFLTKNKDISESQAGLVSLSTAVGTGLALGIGMLVSDSAMIDDDRVFGTVVMSGALLGFGAGYYIFANSPQSNTTSWNWSLNPEGLLALAGGLPFDGNHEILNVEYHF